MLYGAIAADVIDSTSLTKEDILQLGDEIRTCLTDMRRYNYHSFWGRVVKGDTFECCVDDPRMALRLALLVKCRIKAWAGALSCSVALKELGVRFSIGVGSMRINDPKIDIMDGEAIYIAGRNLYKISESPLTSIFGMNLSDRNVLNLLNISITLVDDLVNSLSAKQSEVIYWRLLHRTEIEISNILEISQSSVNSRSRIGGWKLISETLNVYEQINFSDYVV